MTIGSQIPEEYLPAGARGESLLQLPHRLPAGH